MHKRCFKILLGRLEYPGEMKNKGYAKLGGWGGGKQIRCIMGDVQVAYISYVVQGMMHLSFLLSKTIMLLVSLLLLYSGTILLL